MSKLETDQLHTQEDLNSSIYAHALINLNSTHNDHNINEAFTILRDSPTSECLNGFSFIHSYITEPAVVCVHNLF